MSMFFRKTSDQSFKAGVVVIMGDVGVVGVVGVELGKLGKLSWLARDNMDFL